MLIGKPSVAIYAQNRVIVGDMIRVEEVAQCVQCWFHGSNLWTHAALQREVKWRP